MDETGAQRLLDAVITIAQGEGVAAILDRTASAACALTGAPEGAVLRTGAAPPGEPGARTLVVPIEVRGERVAEVRLTGKDFTEADAAVVRTLLTAAGGAVGNALRYEQADQRERWLRASHDVTSALLAGDDPEDTLHLIADRARLVAGATAGGVARPRPDDPGLLEFEVVEPPGPDADRLTGLTVPVEGSASGRALASGQPVVVRKYGEHVVVQQAGSGVSVPQVVSDLDSAIAVPLTVGGQALGVLVVAKLRDEVPFTDTEVELARTFGAHAALAMEFARAERDRRRLAVLEDRDRIARDLHDLVIQRLFAVALGLDALGGLLAEEKAAALAHRFVGDLDRTIAEVRNSIFSLQRTDDPAVGLRSRLAALCAEYADVLGFEPRAGFRGAVDSAVPVAVEADLFAVLREGLSNVARHGKAGAVTVDVEVDARGRELKVTVTDDGIGLPERPGRRSGLANLAARAARWDGSFEASGTPGQGTVLTWAVRLPSGEKGWT